MNIGPPPIGFQGLFNRPNSDYVGFERFEHELSTADIDMYRTSTICKGQLVDARRRPMIEKKVKEEMSSGEHSFVLFFIVTSEKYFTERFFTTTKYQEFFKCPHVICTTI